MNFYVQVQRPGTDGKWQNVDRWRNQAYAIQEAIHTFANRDNPQSRDVMAVRVVKGKRKSEVVFERITS